MPVLDADGNDFHSTIVPFFNCPSDGEVNSTLVQRVGILSSLSNYVGNGGSMEGSFIPFQDYYDGVLTQGNDGRFQGLLISQIADGTSNTFMFGETVRYSNTETWNPYSFANTASLSMIRTGHGVFNPEETETVRILRNSFASNHPGGANFSLCDGSTTFIQEGISHNQLTRTQRDAGEILGAYQRLFGCNDGLVNEDF